MRIATRQPTLGMTWDLGNGESQIGNVLESRNRVTQNDRQNPKKNGNYIMNYWSEKVFTVFDREYLSTEE